MLESLHPAAEACILQLIVYVVSRCLVDAELSPRFRAA